MRCAYGLCNSDSRYKHKEFMKDVNFILFPKQHENLERCKIWVNACGRDNFSIKNVSLNTYMCTKHFVGGRGPTKDNPNPVPQHREHIPVKRRIHYKERMVSKESNSVKKIKLQVGSKERQKNDIFDEAPGQSTAANEIYVTSTDKFTQTESISLETVSVQTLNTSYVKQLFKKIESSRSVISTQMFKISFDILIRDQEKFKFFSGLSTEIFEVLYNFLGTDNKMNQLQLNTTNQTYIKRASVLSCKDKLLLTLIRLRRGFTCKELGYFFQVSSATVSRIVYCYIQFMYLEFRKLKKVMFQDRHLQKRKLPCFKSFPNLRVIVDCTEIPIEMPRNFKEQGNTYSNYKHSNTVKFLVGISTSGAIIYISDGYEGAETDAVLFEEMIPLLSPGDVIMADRGFNVQHKLDPVPATLLIPPFLKGRAKLSREEELITKRIAKARIHVEHVNKRIKDFKIFSKTIRNTLLPTISQIFYIVCCLVNFETSDVM